MSHLLEKRIRCLLINSKFSTFSFCSLEDVCKLVGAKYPTPPLGLMTVAALLPQQWEFKLLVENVEPLRDEHFEWADIVCTGGMLFQQRGVLSIIEKAHQHGCPVVVGGPDPTSQPHFYESADYLVLGEGEVTISMFLQDLEKGCKSGKYQSSERPDMTEAVAPRFDLIRFKDYLWVGIQYSRGCPFNCEFCDIIELYGRKPRTKTPEQIIGELQTLFDLGYRGQITFVDENFIGKKKQVKKLLLVIREWSEAKNFPFFFMVQASLDLADDEELLKMMEDVDIRFVWFGIETPEDEALKLIQKKQNINKPIVESIKKLYSYGMTVDASFIMGFDNETDRIADGMINCIQDAGIPVALVGLLYALPNTQLGRRLKREGRLYEESLKMKDDDIAQLTSGLNFTTTRPRLDILRDFIQVLKHIYEPRNYFKRATYTATHLRRVKKYRPGVMETLWIIKGYLGVCNKIGFSKTTAWPYWKMLFTVLFRNPSGVEAGVTFAAMYLHLRKYIKIIIDLTNRKTEFIESYGEECYHQLRFQDTMNSTFCNKTNGNGVKSKAPG